MVIVRGLAGDAHAGQRDDVRGGVNEGVEAVGENADRARGQAQHDLGAGDDQVEEEDPPENLRDLGVARLQNTRACGTGHQRIETLPMMYFFGTKPQ